MADPSKFHLQVTAGPSYDPSTHKLVPVNTTDPISIESGHLSAKLNVRIQNFRGLPENSPETSPYFEHDLHTSSLYSIAFTFTPKHDISGDDLVFGNDFEKPIKNSLPTGFSTALRIVQWAIDPGLAGDVYADHPYLYGPLLSSINTLWIGNGEGDKEAAADGEASNKPVKDDDEDDAERDQDELEAAQARQQNSSASEPEDVITEGGSSAGVSIRDSSNIPSASAARMKHFLTQSHRRDFTFSEGRAYACDFFNPYLDFNDLSLKLPGISLQLMRFWDGQPLRYTLKERKADGSVDRELLVVVFTLVPEEEVEEQEKKWRGAPAGTGGGGAARRPVDQAGVGGGGGGADQDDDVD